MQVAGLNTLKEIQESHALSLDQILDQLILLQMSHTETWRPNTAGVVNTGRAGPAQCGVPGKLLHRIPPQSKSKSIVSKWSFIYKREHVTHFTLVMQDLAKLCSGDYFGDLQLKKY